jgi:hypothetical protein
MPHMILKFTKSIIKGLEKGAQSSFATIKENLDYKHLGMLCLYLGIIFSFFQINAAITEDIQWSGRFNPYTTFQIHLSDLMFLLTIIFYGLHTLTNSKRIFLTTGNNQSRIMIAGIFLFVLISYFFSINKGVTFFWIVQFLKLLIVYLIIINRLISEKKLIMLILWCLSLQVGIAVVQFIAQGSIGLGILGESHLGPTVLNTAKIDLAGTQIIRPYGTLSHANILGGLLSVGFLLSGYLYLTGQLTKRLMYTFGIIFGIGLILSFSRSAWLATLVSIIIFLAFRRFKIPYTSIRNSMLSLLGIIFISHLTGILNLVLTRLNIINGSGILSDPSVTTRLEQIKTSFSTMIHHPFGVGLGNYTNAAGKFSPENLMPWEFEPAHNVFLLIGTELGVTAMLALIICLALALWRLFETVKQTQGKYRCFPLYFVIIMLSHLFILCSLDHYFYTNYSATIFLMAILGILTNYLINLEDSGVSLG